MASTTNDEWELSKENIQPLQQGRKPEVLKVALGSQPEDLIAQQRQTFENELRTYTGDDPLSVWCKYIKWVEQNFPKGGRDGHLQQLIQQCLSVLRDKSHYYNDKRFIEVWIKFANVSLKSTDVYNFMYSHNIGCRSANFFIAWSWELEHQGNLKRADQVLSEGIQRKAEPIEKLKSYCSEFEMRVASKVMTDSEQISNQEESGRSAFSVLKPKKKNLAPVVRIGESVIEPSRDTMTVGRQQPLPRSNVPSMKVQFKIYNAENLPPSLPVQSEAPASFILYSDTTKENEKKPSKWNTVKLKQMDSVSRSVGDANPGFKLHCDEDTQPASTSRSVPRVSNILRTRKDCPSPPMALFEPPDPMKQPMYDKNKIYGGAEEFSLEEIRAAAWIKRREEIEKERKMAEQERILFEQQAHIRRLEWKVQLLQGKEINNYNTENLAFPCTSNEENIYVENENIENVPPDDYVQETSKRELSGILQPSKNIMYIPLELQESEDEDDQEEEGLYKENNNHPLQDETLIPPCNTEQFVSAAFLASTPRTQVKAQPKAHDSIHYVSKSHDHPANSCNTADLHTPPSKDVADVKHIYKAEVRTSMRDQSTFPAQPGHLSVIMETSRECYKSSSSSGSSASMTKLSQFSQCYSHEKSNIQKHLSKIDNFKEPKPISQSKDLSSNGERDCSFSTFKEPKPVRQKDNKKEDQAFEIHCSDIDPFDENLCEEILQSLNLPPEYFKKMQSLQKSTRNLKIHDCISIEDESYVIESLVAEGAYGKVYEADKQYSLHQNFSADVSNSKVALKVCKKVKIWEFYICTTLHNRLEEMNTIPDVRSSVMEIISALKFSDGILLASEFSQQGTLLDLVNFYKAQNSCAPECITMYLTLEMLQIVSKIHECKIVHSDIKPDNILLRDNILNFNVLDNLTQKTGFLKLIDFGRAIDLKVFKSGICFKCILKENCPEMREIKPWVFQLDWFGVLNCIHVLLFSEYMKVKQNTVGRWEIEKKFKRYWDQTVWVPLFDELLNIPSCYQQPDIEKFANLIESRLRKNVSTFKMHLQRLMSFYGAKKL